VDKLQYLRKVFAHTIGKTFENYVITQIWSKVEDFGLYPVTQQYIKRVSGYALIDLYFPQINFAIEVDEFAHENNKTLDKIRMDDIFGSINGIKSERIKEGNYNYVKNQIDAVVNKINKKVKKLGPFKWEENWQEIEYKKNFEKVKKRKKLLSSDMIGFERVQVTNDIFGMNLSRGYLQYGKSFFKISPNEYLWFPHLTPNKNWENTVSDDWNIIYEKYIGNSIEMIENRGDAWEIDNFKRYTFAKYKNTLGEISYRFIGVFKVKEKNEEAAIYEKISDEVNIRQTTTSP
jgi:very-short-patch-repair endonuclease